MPKIKTHRGAAKRFKKTGTGKVVAWHPFKSHLLVGKPSRRTRRLRKKTVLAPGDAVRVRRLLPY
ncbi:50S ribosomal protein L35 [Thermodesulfitimonas autotrophica]|uniref:50S ribosomal protein L35 n=1 Tax=Thermodesulfitimonas autotrophica TaxID=1894989 RepID=UPI002FE1F7E5